MRRAFVGLVAGLAWAMLEGRGNAEVPQWVQYQGRVLSGTNLVNGTISLTLRVYTNATMGAALYEDSSSVPVVDGLYSASLGQHPVSGDLADALSHGDSWIEVEINGQTLSPRERIGSVSYALIASGVSSGSLDSASIQDESIALRDLSPSITNYFVKREGDSMTGLLQLPEDGLVVGGDQLYAGDGRIGIGTTTPSASLDLNGPTNSGALLFRVMAGTNRVGWARVK